MWSRPEALLMASSPHSPVTSSNPSGGNRQVSFRKSK
ncbi:jg6304, partial [Pararge aegeria aegeria]